MERVGGRTTYSSSVCGGVSANGSSLKRIQTTLGALYLQKILQIVSADPHLFEYSCQSTLLYPSPWNGGDQS